MTKTCICTLLAVAFLLSGCQGNQATGSTSDEMAIHLKTLRPRALEILKTHLKHNNPHIRGSAIEVAIETGQKDLMAEIVTLMADPTVAVRFTAVMAAGDMLCYGCEQSVRKHLEDPDENVRLAAAYSLLKLKYPEFHLPLSQAVTSTDPTVRANAVLLIGKVGNKEDIPLLYKVMRDESSDEMVKLQTVESIARLKDIRLYRSKLWALLISKYADDKMIGIRGMGALGTTDARDAIATMLGDDIEEVRLSAAEQLGKLGNKAGEKEVAAFFAKSPNLDDTTVANQLAIMAIGRIGSPRLTAYLPKALNCRSEINRLAAAQSVLLLTQ
jgi:HEAT repeat protein